MIEDGRIAWAFDLAAPSARRRELRVMAASVVEAAGKANGLLKPTANFSLEEIAGIILPHRRPDVSGTELQRAFGISRQAISTMVRRRALKASARAKAANGHNGGLKFSRDSLLNFLRRSIQV